jgi:hypothetical protein
MISGQSLHVKSLFTQPNGGCPVATIVLEIPESCKPIAETVTALVETLEKLTVPGRRPRDFSEIENQIAAKVAQVECAAVGAVLASLDATSECVKFDGKLWRTLGLSEKTYFTQAGPTTVLRALYRQVGVHNGPTIDVVALRAGVLGDGWLPGTAKAMAHLLQQGTPREAETTSKRMNRLPYSRSSIERIGHAVGELYVERRLDIEEELADDLAVPREAKSVSIALDRVALPMEEIVINAAAEEQVTRVWHMAHVGALTLHDGAGKALHTVRYACMPEGDIEGIGESLHADLAHILGQRPQLTVVKLADGAPEMRRRLDEIAEGVADDAVDLLDFWHGVEKLGKAARAFTTEDAAKRTVSRWKGWLLNDAEAVARIRRELVEHRGLAAVDEAITYLDNQEHRMNYAAARAAGLPIGSGNVEASCKSIVRLRMVRGGSRWKHAPGERVLHLRALAQSDRWDEGIDLALKPLRKKVRHAA